MTKRVSTIEYLSNLQPVVGKIKEDKEFLSNIHDPFSLAIMNDWINSKKLKYNFTKLQEEEYKNASVHCTYAFKDDYPWGTINDKNNNKIVICKCTNTSCVHFRKCRKDNVKINEVINILDNNDIQDSKLESYIREGDNFIQSIKKNVVSVKDEDKNISGSKLNFNKDINDETSDLSKMVNKTDASKEYQFQKDNIIKSIGFEDFSVVNQEDVINSRLNERIIVNAGPGTGKTWTLINKLIHLINVENIDPDEILVLCFSRAAVNVIQKRLEEAYKNEEIGLEWQLIDIRTFDSFATYLLAYCKNEDNNFKYEFEKLDYDSRIKLADEILKKRNELIEQCAYLIVDEVQDLVSSRARLVLDIIKALPKTSGYCLLGDACQSIYDYQVNDDNEMDSKMFFNTLFNENTDSKLYTFNENFRLKDVINDVNSEYRQAILIEDLDKSNTILNKISNKIKDLNIAKLSDTSYAEIKEKVGKGTIGLLTRTNGQALKISTWFRNSCIPHIVRRGQSDNNFASWISDIFFACSNDTIDYNEFFEIFEEKFNFNSEVIENYWNAIEKLQPNKKSRYKIKDLIENIKYNAKDKLFFTSNKDSDIVISTIHRAKGNEFDNIILLDNDLNISGGNLSKNSLIQEHKVRYVLLTRVKNKVYKIKTKKEFISIDQKGNRRSYQTFKNTRIKRKPKLTNLEVGLNSDLDINFFAKNVETQNIFNLNKELVGQRIKLIETNNENYNPCYKVVLEDKPSLVLGITSEKFSNDLTRIMKKILGLYNNKIDIYYPKTFEDIYIDDVITIIKEGNNALEGAKRYGDLMIWKGITISGFAKADFARH